MNLTALWFVSRGAGLVAIVLLTVVFVLGLVLSGRRAPGSPMAVTVMGLHRSLALGTVAFLLLHIGTAVIDTYVPIGLLPAVLPFSSSYSRLEVGLGTIAFDALVAVVASSLLRQRISRRAWHAVHLASFSLWPVAIYHGITMGTSNEQLLRDITIGCAVAGSGAIVWRLATTHRDAERRLRSPMEEWM